MRPYLAIIHDSFRFALSSRVLLVMLVLISVFLLVAAPAGYKEQLTTEILFGEIRNPNELAVLLASGATLEKNAPLRRVWDRLSPALRQRIEEYNESLAAESKTGEKDRKSRPPEAGEFARDLNQILIDRQFYKEDVWQQPRLSPEAKSLIAEGVDSLSDEQVMRLNRVLLESTFPKLIQRGPPTSIRLMYGPIESPFVFRVRVEIVREQITIWLPLFIDKLLLSIGLLIAALVTAPLIPQTFEPGSLTLQLSKPISRSLLFLSKFLGGCAFTFLCATYLFLGVLALLGIRWGIWELKVLWCIPIYVFVFAIYYSVSAFAGLIWRNTVVSIICVIGFWLLCLLLGIVKGNWQQELDKRGFKQLTVVGDDLLGVEEMNVPQRWDETSREWQPALLTEAEQRDVSFGMFSGSPFNLRGLVADPIGQRVFFMKGTWTNWSQDATLVVANAADNFEPNELGSPPEGTFLIVPEQGENILAISQDGNLYRVSTGEPADEADSEDSPSGKKMNVQRCGPADKIPLTRPLAAAMNVDKGVLAIYSRGTIWLFRENEQGIYESFATRKLDVPEDILTSLAFAGDSLLVAQNNGKLLLLNGASLEQREMFEPETSAGPRHVRAAPGGNWFAVAFHTGTLWLIDAKSGEIRKADIKGQGKVSAIEFSGPDRLLVCDGSQRVYEYSLGDESLRDTYSPKMSTGERLYEWIVLPIYTVSPKPREFYQTTQFLLSGKKSVGAGGQMDAKQAEIHPWRPVWSSLIFMVVMLGLACLYIERQEF